MISDLCPNSDYKDDRHVLRSDICFIRETAFSLTIPIKVVICTKCRQVQCLHNDLLICEGKLP